MYTYIQPWITMYNLWRSCKILYNHVQLFTTIYSLVQSCKILLNCVQPCKSMYNLVQPYKTLYIQTYWPYVSIYCPNIAWILPKYCLEIAQILPAYCQNIVSLVCFLQHQNPIWIGLESLVASLQSWHNPVMWPNTGLWLDEIEKDTEGGLTIRGG